MKDEEMAENFANGFDYTDYSNYENNYQKDPDKIAYESYLAGLKAGRPQWHKVFEGEPYSCEYWDLPQDRLPETENFYFVKLKNGFIKICELKYDHWSGKKCFYDLHGGKQSNVAEWLDYPTI